MPDPTTTPLISLNEHPIRDAAIWPVMSPEYSSSRAYSLNDHVVVDNVLYRCISPTAGEIWTPAHWAATTVAVELSMSLQQGIDALHILAREYDPTLPYSVDNYVMKDGSFYRCVTEIQNGETWEPLHWVEVTVATELNAQKDAIEELSDIVTPLYNESNSYSKNDYVIKDGIMYRALVNIAGLEPWDSTKWEECTVGSELGYGRLADRHIHDSIAPEYNQSITYGPNALVMHDGKLYRCVSAIAHPEVWTPEHWALTSVANEVSMTDISSVLGFYIDDDGYLSQYITSDGLDPSTVNLDEVLGFYISADGYISQKVTV